MKPCKITIDLYNTFRERMPEYVQYDRNVPLEITVLENGKPADLNGLFGRLLVSKPDGHEVYSNDVEISGNVITTTLGEQVFTASGVAQVTVDILDEQNSKRALIPFGMRIRSAVITDESIKSSNDYQTITALISDVRALDAMFHVEQEQRAEAFNVQMQSQEATFTEAQRQFLADHREAMFHVEQQMTEQADMFHVEQTERAKAFEQSEADREQRFEAQTTEWAQTVEQAEVTRQFNEERRQSAENERESAEKARESAERQRVDTEAVRQRQEQERGQGEAGRTTAEANRVKAEQTRVDNESSRKSAESSRVNAESQRATAESHRVTAETSRANAESQRATAETNRAGAEGRRSEAESNRVTAESNRATAESNRVTAENAREAQENARREAEEDRATRMAQWEAKAEETAQKAQEAVDSAQAFVNVNEERLLTDRDKIDYWGNHHANMKDMTDATVDRILGDFNTLNHTGEYITATETIARHVPRGTLKGHTEVNCIQEPSGADIVLPYDFEPGYDVTINDTKESGALGVELKGQTLVNLSENLQTITYTLSGWYNDVKLMNNIEKLKRNTYYTILYRLENISGNHQHYNGIGLGIGMNAFNKDLLNNITSIADKNGGWCKVRFQLTDDFIEQNPTYKQLHIRPIRRGIAPVDGEYIQYTIRGFAILEGDYITNPIPFNEVFEGMQSVKMPVLTTTGKNLFDITRTIYYDGNGVKGNTIPTSSYFHSILTGQDGGNAQRKDLSKLIKLSKGVYSFSGVANKGNLSLYLYDLNGNTLSQSTTLGKSISVLQDSYADLLITTPSEFDITDIQLEEGSTVTPYEPFRSSSLTLPEEIALRSLPNGVRDTYNVQTGEYVQRIGETPLNSTLQYWEQHGNSNEEYFVGIVWRTIPDAKSGTVVICNRLKHKQTTREDSCIYFSAKYPIITFSRDSLDTFNIQGFNNKIDSMDLEIQYELAEPIITKIPLSQVLKSWNTLTHINTSIPENSLKPIIAPVNPSYEVMLKPSTQYSIITNPIANGHASTPIEFNLGGSTAETVVGNGCTLITTPSTLINNKLEMSGRGQKLQGGVMVFEGNKTGMVFSHFDGMKSVENPTVYISNQNLFDWTTISTLQNGNQYKSNYQKPAKIRPFFVKKGEKYVVICKGSVNDGQYSAMYLGGDDLKYDNDPNHASKALIIQSPGGVTLKDGVERKFLVTAFKDCLITNIMIHGSGMSSIYTIDYIGVFKADNTQNVTYVPHQSNSLPLTIPMRSLPNGICDTLNLLTGEYVQNVGEIVIDGTENWNKHAFTVQQGDITRWQTHLPNSRPNAHSWCDKMISYPNGDIYNTDYVRCSTNLLWIYQADTTLTREQFIGKLQSIGPMTIQYELATPIVTKLDLQWEDGKLFAYDGTTHFFVDVEGSQLMPILNIDVPVNLAQRTSRLCAEKEQLEAEKAQLANEVSVLQLRNAMLQGEVATLEQSNKNLQKEQEKLDKDNQELAHAVTIVDEHREEGDLELLSSDFDFELRLMEIEFAIGIPMMANYKGVRNMARTPYDMAKALILGGKYEREEMVAKLDRFEKLGSITTDQKAELIALMDAVELTQ